MSELIASFERPDRRIVVRTSAEWTPEAASAAARLARTRGATVIAFVGEDATADQRVLAEAGFTAARREAVVQLSVDRALEALADAMMPEGVEVRSATEVDADRLRLLDDELRNDVPGTSGWRSSAAEFHSDTFGDPAFNPATYLIAMDAASGDYVGLIRVWMNPRAPRIGMIGVRAAYRRRGIASALLAVALQEVRNKDTITVTTEYDVTNRSSKMLFDGLGARQIGGVVEFVLAPVSEAQPDKTRPRVGSRQAVRILLLDEADRVLLVRFRDGDRSWWCTPGGGIERGETDEAAGLREIREELGHDSVELGPCIWTRRHIGVFRGRPFDQSERVYLGRVAAFEPRPSPQALREHGHEDIRWWTLDELARATDEFAPRRLPALTRDIVQEGPPERPIDVGV